ncbi:transporter substrate-binding domain-containing protein [Flavobacterium sp. K5-23]|uniref:transporter substrate-binding domain-containing protein n=1 Tax=Flavobacterium sp. K5-23 TaxID=2746225 RepID=UPI00200C8515|nr:transporter substrate-binding domain-containing protein [Flavobacterium sp. K5-23]UQD57300.1 transporter substrate-binding domain-containing protein [Flavobacterium sp. K5-23]
MKKIIIFFIVVIIVITTVVIFLYKDNSLTDIQEKDTIRIGYSIEAPYAFVKPNGEVTGLSTMVAKEIANRLGIKNIEWRLVEFGLLINELESNKIDIIATGMFITKERSKRINFSEPTFYVKQVLIVVKGNPEKISSYEQTLGIKDFKMAVLEGSIEESLLREIGFKGNQLVLVPDIESGKIAVETYLADGLALTLPALRWMFTHGKMDLLQVAEPFTQPSVKYNGQLGYGAVEFQKKDVQLQKAWNKELKEFIGSPKHIELLTIFGFSKDELPGTTSTRKILKH